MQIAITGCSGLIGSAITEHLFSQGYTIHCLRRNSNQDALIWNADKIESLYKENGPFDAVIHLAGENISTGLWSSRKKKKILQSRVQGTHEIASYFSNLSTPPKVMIFASAIGYYGNRSNEKLTEASSLGDNFLAEVCEKWEEAASPATESGIRTVFTRFGMVLSPKGGALQKMLLPFRMGIGGRLGDGHQYMSWISIADLVAAIQYLLIHEELAGPFNFVSPSPVTNREFTKALGRVLRRYTVFPLPAPVIKILFGQMGRELFLSSSRVYPERLLNSGFNFRHTHLKDALNYCVNVE